MEKIKDCLSLIKTYMRIIDDSQRAIADLLLNIELEVLEMEAKEKLTVSTIKKRTPEVERFLKCIDRIFKEEN